MATESNPSEENYAVEVIKGEPCPMCKQSTLTLMQAPRDIPYFGKVFLFSMDCTTCKYHKADVEIATQQDPSRYVFEVTQEEDLRVRVVKSADATVKIPYIGEIIPGPASNGYVTNIEGIINRMKHQIESLRDSEEESPEARKKAKNLIKKLQQVLWGRETLKIIIEDPTGNSAIISPKATKQKLK
ncbi:MAG: ZPR1 zinc finger domain-containing protein [Candidatus Woesearchaeota archaeon]